MPSCYKYDGQYPGIRFFGNLWRHTVTSAGACINWRQEIGVEFDIPTGAVLEGNKLELNVWPCHNGPFQLPEHYELASPVFLISPSFQFSSKISLKMCHFSNLETVEDCETMTFLSAPATPHASEAQKEPEYLFKELKEGVFEPDQDYGQILLKHFCLTGVGRKRKQSSSSLPSKRQRSETNIV